MSHYKTLGVSESAPDKEIKRAYRALVKKWHPDVNDSPQAAATFRRVAEAYEVLSDDSARSKYDASLAKVGIDAALKERIKKKLREYKRQHREFNRPVRSYAGSHYEKKYPGELYRQVERRNQYAYARTRCALEMLELLQSHPHLQGFVEAEWKEIWKDSIHDEVVERPAIKVVPSMGHSDRFEEWDMLATRRVSRRHRGGDVRRVRAPRRKKKGGPK